MHVINHYSPPSTADLQKLKDELGLTGEQMAKLAAIGGSHQWRKYTGGVTPREMSLHMLFFMVAQLHLNTEQRELLFDKMREMGADIDASET